MFRGGFFDSSLFLFTPWICRLGCFLLLLSRPRIRLRVIIPCLLEGERIRFWLSLEQIGYLQLLRCFILENGFSLFNGCCYWLRSFLSLGWLSNFSGLLNFLRAGNLSIGGLQEWARLWLLNWLRLLNWFGLCHRNRLCGRISLFPWIRSSRRCCYIGLYGVCSIRSDRRGLHLLSRLILFQP